MRTCQHQYPASAGCPSRCQLVHNRRFTTTADKADIMFLSVSKKIKRTVRHQLHLAKMYLYYITLTKKGCRLPATAFNNISLYLP